MSLNQKIKKIRRLTLSEIAYRSRERFYLKQERKRHSLFVKRILRSDFNFFDERSDDLFELFNSDQIIELCQKNSFMRKISVSLDESKKRNFVKNFKNEFKKSIERANAFIEHRFSFLGVSFKLPNPIPWQSDPISLKPYPTGFYADIDIFTNENPGDVKHVWEMNRLQFLIEIAKAYYLTSDDRMGRKIDDLLNDWFQKNPYQTGIAWASALEVGVRAFALIWTLYFYLGAKKQNPQTLRIILKLLYLSGYYLNHHLSIYFSPYNHLIGETAALFAIGYLFPGFKNANRWAKKALIILDDQVEKQFHADGGSVEQATFYHHFTLGFYLLTMSFLRHNGEKPSERMSQRVEKAMEFAMYMMRPDGTLPYIGDIDDARSIYFSDPTNWDFRSYQCFGAAWFNRSDMKYMAQKWQEDAFWMLGEEDQIMFETLPTKTPDDKTIFLKDSGYYIFRSGYGENDHFSFMDAGPLAHGVFKDGTPSAAHGHADLLSIEIAPYGESILIDPGFSNYRGEYDWHTYFRSTLAHNTVTINGQSQAKQTGILKWSFAPDFKVLKTVRYTDFSMVCAEHYGYQRLPGAPVHRRCFAFVDQHFWIVLDDLFLDSEEVFDLSWNFHFNKDVRVVSGRDGKFEIFGENSGMQMIFESLDEKEWLHNIFLGDKEPQYGWISPTYRARTPAPLLQIYGKTAFPLRVLTLFLPFKKQTDWDIGKKQNEIILTWNKNIYNIKLDDEPVIQFAGKIVKLTTEK